MDEADAFDDTARAGTARQEIETFTEHLARAVGMGGRDRLAASQTERARVNVTRLVRGAVAAIARDHPSLGNHLQRTSATGTFCSYALEPGSAMDWRF